MWPLYRGILFSFIVRYKNGKKLHELFSILMSIMTDICQRQFRFLKFSFGPVCPNPRCPGSSSDGKVLASDPSSGESDEDNDGNSTCDEDCAGPPGERRQHVICIDPVVPKRPLWCNSTPVHEFEEIKQWLVKVRDHVSRNALYVLLSSAKDSQMECGG